MTKTKKVPEQISITVVMPQPLAEWLDRQAKQLGDCSRAAVIRQLVLRALEQQEKTA